ncbi:MAG: hypothetical protein ACXVFN_08920 [Solirubrobacteraceae bacterium]
MPDELDELEDDDELLELELLLPQAAMPNADTARVRAMTIARRELLCTDPP